MSDVTAILNAIEAGDPQAASQLLPLVYDELRKLAAAKMANEKPGQTLDATALVHEAYLRLVANPGRKSEEASFDGRGHFLAAAAEAMRRILIDNARRKKRLKRGAGGLRLELLDVPASMHEDHDLILSLDDLLKRLENDDLVAANTARLYLLGGLSVAEAAEVLRISRAAAYRNWKYARAWLRDALCK